MLQTMLSTSSAAKAKLALGTAGFGGEYESITLDMCAEITQKCLENGVNYFDTAPHYGKGLSETNLGKCLSGIERDKFILSTKAGRVGNDFDYSKEAIIHSVMRSLRRLEVEYFDIVFVHDIEFAPSLDFVLTESIPALVSLKKKGLIKHIGVSGLPLDKLDHLIFSSIKSNPIEYVLSYCCYTLINDTLSTYAKNWTDAGITIIQGGVTSMGLLTPQGPQSWHPASDEIKQKAIEIVKKHQKQGLDIVQQAYNFTRKNPHIKWILVGATNTDQIKSYLDWSKK